MTTLVAVRDESGVAIWVGVSVGVGLGDGDGDGDGSSPTIVTEAESQITPPPGTVESPMLSARGPFL